MITKKADSKIDQKNVFYDDSLPELLQTLAFVVVDGHFLLKIHELFEEDIKLHTMQRMLVGLLCFVLAREGLNVSRT